MSTITVTNLGKAYKQYPTRWSRLAEWLIPFSKPHHHLKWALQDFNFKVNTGETVGFIGISGAGKSTLLKKITGTPRVLSVNFLICLFQPQRVLCDHEHKEIYPQENDCRS